MAPRRSSRVRSRQRSNGTPSRFYSWSTYTNIEGDLSEGRSTERRGASAPKEPSTQQEPSESTCESTTIYFTSHQPAQAPLPLTRRNLGKLEGDSSGDSSSEAPPRERRRSCSDTSRTSRSNDRVESELTFKALSFYRYTTLCRARIYIVPDLPPEHVQTLVDTILFRKQDDARSRKSLILRQDSRSRW
jgi:hypothetical protein